MAESLANKIVGWGIVALSAVVPVTLICVEGQNVSYSGSCPDASDQKVPVNITRPLREDYNIAIRNAREHRQETIELTDQTGNKHKIDKSRCTLTRTKSSFDLRQGLRL